MPLGVVVNLRLSEDAISPSITAVTKSEAPLDLPPLHLCEIFLKSLFTSLVVSCFHHLIGTGSNQSELSIAQLARKVRRRSE